MNISVVLCTYTKKDIIHIFNYKAEQWQADFYFQKEVCMYLEVYVAVTLFCILNACINIMYLGIQEC